MKLINITTLLFNCGMLFWLPCSGQQIETPTMKNRYNYRETFHSIFQTGGNREYRTATGLPGAHYWQNSTDYRISVSLNDKTDEIKGTAELHYKNNSPDTLDFVWLYLEQNLFKKDSRGDVLITGGGSIPNPNGALFDGGMYIKSVKEISADGKVYTNTNYLISDTRMQVWLKNKVLPQKGKVTLIIEYSYTCPTSGAARTGIYSSQKGKIYTIAQWYPRMCVYDDIRGWNTIPYTGKGEFYSDYGDFDISITAPASHIVLCSGELINAHDVYNKVQQSRWEQARLSDKAITIRTASDVESAYTSSSVPDKTWHFVIKNARDAAWASSAAFMVTAARINLPSGKKSLSISAFPVESNGATAWQRATEFGKASIEYYSRWFEYPYPTAINIAGAVGGMEYPGIVFCGLDRKGRGLWNVIDHEQGHSLFPIIVGSNEKVDGWMDEGFNVFLNGLSTMEFNNGEFKSGPVNRHLSALEYTRQTLEPVMTPVSQIKPGNRSTLLYSKPAIALSILRSNILGETRFDSAFKYYIHRWAFKHPAPEDFFRTIENVSGEDLSWFWRSWFLNNWQLDQAIKELKIVRNDTVSSAIITIANNEKMTMPVELELQTKSGEKSHIKLPVEIWESNSSFDIKLSYKGELKSVELDPDKNLPDINPQNNIWTVNFNKETSK